MTKTHDEELVERIAPAVAMHLGYAWEHLKDESDDWPYDRNSIRALIRKVFKEAKPLITRKAKEEMLEQMMDWAEQKPGARSSDHTERRPHLRHRTRPHHQRGRRLMPMWLTIWSFAMFCFGAWMMWLAS